MLRATMLRATILLVLLTTVHSVFAVDKPFFLYGGALTQEYTIDNGALMTHADTISGMNSDLDSHDNFNVTVGIGYSIHPNIKVTLDRTTDLTFDNRSILFDDTDSHVDLVLTQLAVEASYLIAKRFSFSGKVGRALISQEYDIESDTQTFNQSRNNNEYFYDLGVNFSINKSLSVKVGYQKIDFFDLEKQYAQIIWYL